MMTPKPNINKSEPLLLEEVNNIKNEYLITKEFYIKNNKES